jgi:hypothetical protein
MTGIGNPDYDAGYLAGAAWGINTGRRQTEAEQMTLDERDERLARRIVAMLLQHDYNGQLIASLGAKPINWRARLQPDCEDNPTPHDLWPAGFESEDA